MPKTTLPLRSVLRFQDTWNATSVFPDRAAWDTEYEHVQAQFPLFRAYQGTLSEGPTVLAEALDALFQLSIRVKKLFMYALVSARVDNTDQEAASLVGKAATLQGQLQATVAFVQPELLALGAQTLLQWTRSDARVAVYTHYLEDLLRQQTHVCSTGVETLLGLLSDPFDISYTTWRLLVNVETRFAPARSSTGEAFPVAQGTILSLLSSSDRQTRQTAWEHYQDGYLAVQKTLASNLDSRIKQNIFLARVRGYQSALEARLATDNLPREVYSNVIETCRRHLPIWHRYWALRKRVLGYETLHTYDLHFSLTTSQPSVPYTQAVEWMAESLQPLGSQYVAALRRGCLQERWADIYPNQGKGLGAFSTGCPGTYPFLVLNYTETLKALSTFAHELGHSMHSYLTWQTQPLVYTDYSIFAGEVASNFHQAMVRAYLLRTQPEREMQIGLLDEALNNFHRYCFLMPMLARLELEMYERVEHWESLTADLLKSLFADFLAEGYGKEVLIDVERDGITWATFGHLYMNFYAFRYITGIAGAHVLAQGVLASQPHAVERYLEFLRTGSARYPLDALQRAGVDLRTPEPIEKAFAVLTDYIGRLEHLTTS